MRSFVAILMALISVANVFAAVPENISYQAIVRNSTDELVRNQPISMRISILKDSAGGQEVFAETHQTLTNTNGVVSVQIGSLNPMQVDWSAGPYLLKTEIDLQGGTNYTITGTSQMLSVPYALYAKTSGQSGGSSYWQGDGNNIRFNNGAVGINAGPLRARFQVEEHNQSDTTVTINGYAHGGTGVSGISTATSNLDWMNAGVAGYMNTQPETSGRAMYGWASGTGLNGFGVFGGSGLETGINYGVHGVATSRTGNTMSQYGGFFRARGDFDPENGVGTGTHYGAFVIAEGAGDWNIGLSARANNGLLYSRGIQSTGDGRTGIYNQGGVFFGNGVGHESDERTRNVGIIGQAIDNRLRNIGVQGSAFGNVNPQSYITGVYGFANGFGGEEAYGVDGTTNARNKMNVGVAGYAFGQVSADSINYGVYAFAENADTTYAVYAIAVGEGNEKVNYGIYAEAANGTEANYAGFFEGDVTVTGNLNVVGNIAKAGGTFRIDHPLDPENKYLVHSFVESPEMMNVYSGNIVTNAEGLAEVKLPDYFEAANKDFRYQLTVIGTFAQAIVKEEVVDNAFVIQTNEPNVKVSWQVSGVRNDKYAQRNRIQPEQLKRDRERGQYLHPEVYGLTRDGDKRNRDRNKVGSDMNSSNPLQKKILTKEIVSPIE